MAYRAMFRRRARRIGQHSRRGSQAVRQRSAKPLFGGSIPPRASTLSPIVFESYQSFTVFSIPSPSYLFLDGSTPVFVISRQTGPEIAATDLAKYPQLED